MPAGTPDCRADDGSTRTRVFVSGHPPRPSNRAEEGCVMQVLHERCCGLDIHKRLIVACAITPGPDGPARRGVRRFGPRTADSTARGDWTGGGGVSAEGM